MGALTSNRNKREASFRSSSSGSVHYNRHTAKKLKSLPDIDPTKTSRSSASSLSIDPQKLRPNLGLTSNRNKRDASFQSSPSGSDITHPHIPKKLKSRPYIAKKLTPFFGKLHAPFRFVRGFTGKLKKLYDKSRGIIARKFVSLGDMGNALFPKHNNANEIATDTCKHVRLNQGSDVMDVDGEPSHEKLQNESDEKHDISLRRLKFDVKLLEENLKLQEENHALRQQLRAKIKEDRANDPFRPLTEEEQEMVDIALSYSNMNKVLVTHENSNITITGEVLQCLSPGAYLNDEVINLYLELLKERENRKPEKFLKCHFFNTFFYKKLISGSSGYDYNSVKRWTTHTKLGYSLLDCDKIFVPIHREMHWCLAVINKKEEKFQYLDSLGGKDDYVLRELAKYITDEVNDKTGRNIDVTSWKQEFVTDKPNQENGYDCGMFMIKYADFYSRDIGLCFNQVHMPYFRLRTAMEILKLKAN